MSVNHILSPKGHEVVAIPLDHTLGEAVRMLVRARIGAVLVSDGEHPVSGILSERDIVRAISDHGAAVARSAGLALHDREGRHLHERAPPSTTSWRP